MRAEPLAGSLLLAAHSQHRSTAWGKGWWAPPQRANPNLCLCWDESGSFLEPQLLGSTRLGVSAVCLWPGPAQSPEEAAQSRVLRTAATQRWLPARGACTPLPQHRCPGCTAEDQEPCPMVPKQAHFSRGGPQGVSRTIPPTPASLASPPDRAEHSGPAAVTLRVFLFLWFLLGVKQCFVSQHNDPAATGQLSPQCQQSPPQRGWGGWDRGIPPRQPMAPGLP